jgi:aspartyl-tRNA(Asn)/glutamyl-tRNA(Gln) amidotransferase subunit A
MTSDLIGQPVDTLAAMLRQGRTSSVDLVSSALERIAAVDGTLQSFVCLASDAHEHARRADVEISAGGWRGPLHGVPIAVKDNYLTSDMPTRAGTSAPGIAFEPRDSSVVARLRAAGAVIIGKTRMHEFAWGNTTPPTRNPWDIARVPGGSSGGSGAAVAAGIVPIALGSDTGGSIRIPASLCGTVGLKPTFGRVSGAGVVPHSWSLDHAGPLSLTVADSAHVLNAIAGHDRGDPGTVAAEVPDFATALNQPITGLRIGVCRNHFFERNETGVLDAVEQAIAYFRNIGAVVIPFEMPILAYGLGAIFAIELSSSTAYHARNIADRHIEAFTDDVRILIEMGRLVTGPDYLKAEQFRRILMQELARIFASVDVIVGPTTPLTAWPIDENTVEIDGTEESTLAASWRLTYPWNLAGLPAISLPCGFDDRGLPIGLQIAGRPFDEVNVLRAAHAYERGHEWKDARPSFQRGRQSDGINA